MKTIYLAGPIAGLDYAGATSWREYVKHRISHTFFSTFSKATAVSNPIEVLSPMRGKNHLSDVKEFSSNGDEYKPFGVLSSNRGIITRDRWDTMRCDVLLVNLLGAKKVSIGTVMEIAWADSKRTPIVCAMEESGNPHEHGMVTEAIGFRVETLDEAINIVKGILLP